MAKRRPHYHDLHACYDPDCAGQRETDGNPQPVRPVRENMTDSNVVHYIGRTIEAQSHACGNKYDDGSDCIVLRKRQGSGYLHVSRAELVGFAKWLLRLEGEDA